MLQVGDKAPDFTLLSDSNQSVSLHDFLGKNVVLYFYPKDNTPGCTQEACDFRDSFAALNQSDCIVLGVSRDSITKHEKFKAKYQLPFTLLADENGDVCEAYNVINKKSMFGNTFLGITRTTFLIDKKGMIRAIWRKVSVKGHIQQILNELNNT